LHGVDILTGASRQFGITPYKIRQGSILLEALACGGDARRLCDPFGLIIKPAERYVVIGPPSRPHNSDRRPATGAIRLINSAGERSSDCRGPVAWPAGSALTSS